MRHTIHDSILYEVRMTEIRKVPRKRTVWDCYIGGLDANVDPKDTRTPAQREQLRRLVKELQQQFPAATLHGHRDFAAKACPCFDERNLGCFRPLGIVPNRDG